MAGFGGGLAGLGPTFSIYECASWVDQKLKPGYTSTSPRTGQPGWWYSWPKAGILGVGMPFIYSPNLVWFAIAVAIYAAFPYDLEAAAALDAAFIQRRGAINCGVGFAWYGYWHVSLYWRHLASRKFDPANTGPSRTRLFHNVWYCLLGFVAWTAWEVAMVHLFATGKAPYTPDSELFASAAGFLPTLALTLALPVLRDFHFYFAHRLIHIRCLYKYVHALHHRNKDPEPFSGMCMHPIEHIFYLSCAALSLYVKASPFLLTWNLVHAVLAPAAGHSGFEDHWQSDQFHHLHHQYFECNYGNIGFPFDKWFGTIRHAIGDRSDYKGTDKISEGESKAKKSSKAPLAYLRGSFLSLRLRDVFPMKADEQLYCLFTCSLPALLWWVLTHRAEADVATGGRTALAMAVYVAIGPVVMGLLLATLFKDRLSMRWPFHKEGLIGSFGWHLAMCVLAVVVPTYQAVELVYAPIAQA